ncbi:MAG: CDGSH iron-sulfur domain-containing protein [Ignavibacteria bacterium]|nr:CDGSH iron-sulfur domain-containing protein [Ignavibacteria bacterium]
MNIITLTENGPLGLTGNITIVTADGAEIFSGDSAWLCRCGQSQSKPFCDGSHKSAMFECASAIGENKMKGDASVADAALKLTLMNNGPILLSGATEIRDTEGKTIAAGDSAALCRCGRSANKPFCDGAHKVSVPPVAV